MTPENKGSRKPATRASVGRPVRLPLPEVRRRIWQQAVELVSTKDARELDRVLANRFNISERAVHIALVGEGMRHEREAATLRNAIVNALDLARDAVAAVDEEIADVA